MAAKKPTRTIRAYRWENPIIGSIVQRKKIKIGLEKEDVLRQFVEQNLSGLFRLKLIESEFRLGTQSTGDRRSSPRPDTLAFDEEKKCFVVIEYKKEDANRIFKQLSTYAGAQGNSRSQMAMITAYSKRSYSESWG